MLRSPAVAGQFYPGSAAALRAEVHSMLDPKVQPQPYLLAVSPHAGYVYSGRVAGMVLSRVAIPRRVLVAGPNHRGLGEQAALTSQGAWATPLGEVPLDAELGAAILRQCPMAREDSLAHRHEHSLEVQVPFLQVLRPDLLLTPLCLSMLTSAQCAELGRGLAQAIQSLGEPVLLVASTDMTHYESAASAKGKDELAIARILALDPQGLYETVRGRGISMCGVLPTTVLLTAAIALGATSAELVAYTNSGQVTGDMGQVVAYAGLLVK